MDREYTKNVLQNQVTATVWKEMIGYGLEKVEKMLIKYLKKEGGRLFTIDNGLLPDEGNKAVYMCLRKYFSIPEIGEDVDTTYRKQIATKYNRKLFADEHEEENSLSPGEARELAEH